MTQNIPKQQTSPNKPSLERMKEPWSKFYKHSFIWSVVLPFLIICAYYGFYATDRYVSEAKIIVKKADSSHGNDFGLSLLGAGMNSGLQDSQLVREYILSLDMLKYLDEELNLRSHYESRNVDVLSRLWASESQEGFLEYYRKRMEVKLDETSGIITLRAQAFTPEFAKEIISKSVLKSESFINKISQTLAKYQLEFVKGELNRASEHLKMSKQAILAFQDQYLLFSPEAESGAKLELVNKMEAEISQSRAELNNLLSYMNDSASDVITLRTKISALESQLQIERAKLVNSNQQSFSDVNARYAELKLEMEFATDIYKSSLLGLEQARVEVYRKLKHLVIVDSSSLPEDAVYPRRIYNIVNALTILLLSYGTLRIIFATIREHRDV